LIMPELPEVEVLARQLRPALRGKTVCHVQVRRSRVIRPTSERELEQRLAGAKFKTLSRRGKYLLFEFRSPALHKNVILLGHLGMTGRMFISRKVEPLPKHAAVVLELCRGNFVYEDARYFGRLTLDLSAVEKLGPEPLEDGFSANHLAIGLGRSQQPVKVKLLDQSLVAGIGNTYASEALFRAGISPRLAANRLTFSQIEKLFRAIREVLSEAVDFGSTIPLNFSGGKKSDTLFYFGRAAGAPGFYEERLRVYDRAGKPCLKCGAPVKRIVQAARSTFFCPACQKA
jgi:formamidopyrimidine-DNA glycosylase